MGTFHAATLLLHQMNQSTITLIFLWKTTRYLIGWLVKRVEIEMYAHMSSLNMYPNIYFIMHMWQSRVEIEHYSIAYFARIDVFEAL